MMELEISSQIHHVQKYVCSNANSISNFETLTSILNDVFSILHFVKYVLYF